MLPRLQTIIPLAVEFFTMNGECSELLIGNLDALGIGVGVEFAPNFEASVSRCICNQLDNGEVAGERLATPILVDVAKHAMFDLVPFRCPRWIMADLEFEASFISKLLESHLPQPDA